MYILNNNTHIYIYIYIYILNNNNYIIEVYSPPRRQPRRHALPWGNELKKVRAYIYIYIYVYVYMYIYRER